MKAETWLRCGRASGCVSAVSFWLSSGMKVLTSRLLPPSQRLDLFHAQAQSASAWHTKWLTPMPPAGQEMPVWKSLPQAPPAFFSSYLFHCSCIVLPSSSGLGALFCLSHYSFHAIYCLLTWRAFPPPPLSIDSESSASWNPGVIVLRNSFCNKIDLIQTSSVLQSQEINSLWFRVIRQHFK